MLFRSVYVLHADNEKAGEEFAESIKQEFGITDVTLQPVGPVIGAHCGPGTIGLIFHCSGK